MIFNTENSDTLQAAFLKDEAEVDAFIRSVSAPRFSRYLRACDGNARQACDLYLLNAKLSQSLYLLIQVWEICLRNRIDDFLKWKYGRDWPHEPRLRKIMTSADLRRLDETIRRQSLRLGVAKASTDSVVADLSAGYWVSLLGKSYDIPFSWRYNLARIYPHDRSVSRAAAADLCRALLDLRNRIAHHEPIFHLDLATLKIGLDTQIRDMCLATSSFARHACTFAHFWTILRPAAPSDQDTPGG